MMMFRLLCVAFAATIAATAPAAAQLVPESDEPVDITSDSAEFQDNHTVWTGNVRVVQGEAILTAKRIEATLSDGGELQSFTASGSVRYSNGKEAITGERAVYEDAARTITVTENVIVTQGKQIMAAGAVTYWVDTGKVKFAPEPGKRIRGIFYTDANDQI